MVFDPANLHTPRRRPEPLMACQSVYHQDAVSSMLTCSPLEAWQGNNLTCDDRDVLSDDV